MLLSAVEAADGKTEVVVAAAVVPEVDDWSLDSAAEMKKPLGVFLVLS